MHRIIAVLCALTAAGIANAVPPTVIPYFDDVEGLARLAWQATKHENPAARMAAVEQMVRVSAYPRRVDMVLATIENKDPVTPIRQAASRIRAQLRIETQNMIWVDAEVQAGVGRSEVAHDPIPYREALASLRTANAR